VHDELCKNLCPVKIHHTLADRSLLKPEKLQGVDILVLRELTGGLYFGQPKMHEMQDGYECAVDTLEYFDHEIRRIVNLAFDLAKCRRKKATSVDKANVLESSRLWRQVATRVGLENPNVVLEHVLVDTADVVVIENMFGDIFTDEASVLAGSMGMLPSASLGETGSKLGSEARIGLYEPIHGFAPDIAGKGIANPIGTILSTAMMMRYSFKLESEACAIEDAVHRAVTDGGYRWSVNYPSDDGRNY
jgi:3-isopropylmalate dehydrogenase